MQLRSTLRPLLQRSVRPSCLRLPARAFSLETPVTVHNAENEMLKEMVVGFANEHIRPLSAQMDDKAQMDKGLLQKLFDQGLMSVHVPAEYGGAGMGFTQSIIVVEELSRVDPGVGVIADVHNTLINTILLKYGNEAQKSEWLPQTSTGVLGSFCLSEAGSGSDAFAMKTSAVREGDTFRLNGNKLWITNAMDAGLFIVMAVTDPSKGYKGTTAFLVPAGTPGLEVGKKEDKLGIRASSTCEVSLRDVVVPASAVLGEIGKGYKIAIESLNEGRIGIGAQMLGAAQGAFDLALPYTHTREQFGQKIANFQGMQFSIAENYLKLEAARALVYNAARLMELGQPFTLEAALAKLYCSRIAGEVCSDCIDMVGGVGITKDFGLEKFYRDVKVGTIYEGTSNLQLQTIAKLVAQKEGY